MQGRMKHHQLSKIEIDDVLKKAEVGRIGTHNENGYPYVVPVHFIVYDEKIYIHGLIKGQKISNLTKNDKVGFEVMKWVQSFLITKMFVTQILHSEV
ncbi:MULTISPECIES: pyridoxamine 5'-phosphate oxidase family protein [unclassified Dysgonomonas]|uniref:pyridoxamine 5'-phosphate oxidase family protein n=1 Tax=unclassified Dysgonomonas TaxID=2630389 RepID=UPI0025B97030|nr:MULTISPECIES: pyridoxamine 5'-phosphate oxidase family protein [unclassified Dysgonomonas]